VILDVSLIAELKKPFNSYIFTGNSPSELELQAKLFASKILFDSDTHFEHPDIRYVDSENLYTVGVQDIREIIDSEALQPVSADYKIYIFTPYKNLTEEALNALLKTLEDPSSSTIYILLEANQFWAHQLDEGLREIPETVKSRCRKIYLSSKLNNEFDMSLSDFKDYFKLDLNEGHVKQLHNLISKVLSPPKDIYEAAYYSFNLKLEADNITKELKENEIQVMNQSVLISTIEYLSTSLINQIEIIEKSQYRYSELLFKAIEEISRGMRPRVVLMNAFVKASSNE
tara:strand:+ start:340 stop:1197 length:858 start_codon:yes stop_codon:yes gene_type:complete